jgi:hypothetical protein
VVQFIASIVTTSGVPHEWREEGLVILTPEPEVVAELSGSASVPDQVSQPSDGGDEDSEEVVPEPAPIASTTHQVAGDDDNYAEAMVSLK